MATLQGSSINLGYNTNPVGVYESDLPDHTPGYMSPYSIDPMDPITTVTTTGIDDPWGKCHGAKQEFI
jgi:hypothetical protein